jgi:hypothetical protein
MSALHRWQVYWGLRQSTPAQIFRTPAELFEFHIRQGCLALHGSLQEFFQAVLAPDWTEIQCWAHALLDNESSFEQFKVSTGLSLSDGQWRSVLRLISVHDKIQSSRWTLLEHAVLLGFGQERVFGAHHVPKAFREVASLLVQLHKIEQTLLNPLDSLSLTDAKMGLQRLDYFYSNAPQLHPVWSELKEVGDFGSLAA